LLACHSYGERNKTEVNKCPRILFWHSYVKDNARELTKRASNFSYIVDIRSKLSPQYIQTPVTLAAYKEYICLEYHEDKFM